nr:ribonuclease H-like domain-containing protein [Tanacetum cinerariifolium]
KDRFSTSKPTNFSDEYLLLTLKTRFEEPDRQDGIWRNQKSVHGLALVKRWKLLTSCGVHIITLSTIQLILLVERRYPLSRFTLEQLVNVTRLQVEEESEMSLELLRFTRQQLQEYQQEYDQVKCCVERINMVNRNWLNDNKCGSQVAYLLFYVDDIILTDSSTTLLQQLIDSLHREFGMTDLGTLNYFLGIFFVRQSTLFSSLSAFTNMHPPIPLWLVILMLIDCYRIISEKSLPGSFLRSRLHCQRVLWDAYGPIGPPSPDYIPGPEAPPLPDYIPGPEAPPLPDYIPGPEAPPSPDYIQGPEYPEYLPPADDMLPVEEQPLPAAVSPTVESPGYITELEPEMEPEENDGDDEKSEGDSIDYPTSKGDNDANDDGDDLSEDDADDEDKEESSDSEKEEKEHLALIVPALALYSSISVSDETEPFEEGETAATPPPFGYRVAARISVQPHILMPFRLESKIRPTLTIADKCRADDKLIGRLRREKMAPKRARTTRANLDPTRTTTATEPITQEAITNLIAQRVTKSIAECKTQRNNVVNGDTSNTTGTGPRTVRPTRECTYK